MTTGLSRLAPEENECYNAVYKKTRKGNAMNVSLRDLSPEQAREIYKTYLVRDFPPNERKPWAMIQRRLQKGGYRCRGLFEGENLRGYAFFVLDGALSLLDYFAVLETCRGQGYGSAFLKLLIDDEASQWVLVEAEDPAAASSPEDRDARERRLRFYLRNALMDTGARAWVFGVDYVLLSFPRPSLTAQNAAQAYAEIYRSFLPAAAYQKWIKITPEARKESAHEVNE